MDPTWPQDDLATIPIHRLGLRRSQPETPDTGPKQLAADAEKAVVPCPRCGGPLINPEKLGWCPKCRYCKAVEEDAPKVDLQATAAPKTSPLGAVEFVNLLAKTPRWLQILGGGVLLIAILSLLARLVLPDQTLARALWSTSQIILGLIGLLAAQVWALIYLAPEDDKLGAKDMIFAGRLWVLTFKRLPQMARQVWTGVWSASAIVTAVFVVGGLSYWARFYKPERIADKNLIQAVTSLAKGKVSDKDLVQSVEDFASKQDLTKKEQEEQEKAKKLSIAHCVILGYNVDPEQRLTELIIGTLHDDNVRYAGRLRRGWDSDSRKELLELLKPLRAEGPFVSLRLEAIWVKPQLFCEVYQSGSDKDGRLKDASFYQLLRTN